MNKVVGGSILGVGGAGTGITVAYSAGAFGGNGVDTVSQQPITTESPSRPRPSFVGGDYDDWKVTNALSNFKSVDSPDCIKKIFSGITKIDETQGYQTTDANKDVSLSFSPEKDSNGCLVVDWMRKESNSNDNKYTGDFTLLWSFAQENQGFITYANFKFEKNGNAKAVADGLVYSLSKEAGDGKPWQITSQYEVWGKEIGNDENKIPKPGSVLKELENKNFWGLKGDGQNLNDLIKESELGDYTTKMGGSYWKWLGSKNGNGKVSDFNSNLDDWWQELFEDCKNKIQEAVQNIKGKWEKILIVNDQNQPPSQ